MLANCVLCSFCSLLVSCSISFPCFRRNFSDCVRNARLSKWYEEEEETGVCAEKRMRGVPLKRRKDCGMGEIWGFQCIDLVFPVDAASAQPSVTCAWERGDAREIYVCQGSVMPQLDVRRESGMHRLGGPTLAFVRCSLFSLLHCVASHLSSTVLLIFSSCIGCSPPPCLLSFCTLFFFRHFNRVLSLSIISYCAEIITFTLPLSSVKDSVCCGEMI